MRSRLGREGGGRGEDFDGGALPAGVRPVEGPAPAQPELIRRVPCAVPHGIGVGQDERPVGRLAAQPLELVQVADEDALELRLVAVAAGRLARLGEDRSELLWGSKEDPADLDEFARCGIERREDIVKLFVPSFFFGCEGDDRLTALAFDTKKNPLGTRLAALYSSDAGHFDLPDMRDAAEEAYELVEHGLITQEDFRDFVFTNPVRAKAGLNPDFFKGTVVQGEVAKLMEAEPAMFGAGSQVERRSAS